MKNGACIKYIIALLLFGSNGIVASRISMNSYEIVMFRTMIGSVLLIALYLFQYRRFTFYRRIKSFGFLAGSGMAMGISWIFLYEAYRQIGVGIASLGYYCGPVIVMAVSPVLFRERFTKKKLRGFLAVLVGIFLVNGNALGEAHTGFGIFCALMSAVMYALMVILNKKCDEITGLENATLQLTTAFLTVFLFVTVKQGFRFSITNSDLPWLLFLGLVNTGIGCYLYFSSIGRLKVQTVAILGYLEPLSAVIFSVIFLHETMLPVQAAGAGFIIGGAVYASVEKKNGGSLMSKETGGNIE